MASAEAGGDVPLEIERKFLVRPVDVEAVLPDAAAADFVQTYLRGAPGETARVRRAVSADRVRWTHTVKRYVGPGVRHEDEREIDGEEYERLLADADPDRMAVRKTRWTFRHGAHVLELDHLVAPRELWLLEVELPSADMLGDELPLPDGIEVLAEVTDDPAYSNAELARPVDGD